MSQPCKVIDSPQKELVVGFPIKGNNLILGERLEEPWLGKLTGPGGKVEDNQTVSEAQVAELEQELGLICLESDLVLNGKIELHFPGGIVKQLHIFRIRNWIGRPRRTSEMSPFECLLDKAPIKKMVPGDQHWFSLIQKNLYFEAIMYRSNINTVSRFELSYCVPLKFS